MSMIASLATPVLSDLARAGQFDAVLAALDELLNIESNPSLLLLQARVLAQRGEFEAARTSARQVLELEPANTEAVAVLAAIERRITHGARNFWRPLALFLALGLIGAMVLLVVSPTETQREDLTAPFAKKLQTEIAVLSQLLSEVQSAQADAANRSPGSAPAQPVQAATFDEYHRLAMAVDAFGARSDITLNISTVEGAPKAVIKGTVPTLLLKQKLEAAVSNLVLDSTNLRVTWEARVLENDSLSAIAQWALGDGLRWPELARLNSLLDADDLPAGTRIKLPQS